MIVISSINQADVPPPLNPGWSSPNPRIMHFFACSLLLLVAPTMCASPVRIESRESFLVTQKIKKTYDIPQPDKRMYDNFHSRKGKRIQEWSDTGEEVVEPIGQAHQLYRIVIKRVDLSIVQTEDGLTQEEQMFAEIQNLKRFRTLDGWYKTKVQGKIYFYIGIDRMGIPASERKPLLSDAEGEEAREKGIAYLRNEYKLVLDDAHSKQNKYFSFSRSTVWATPWMLRYAKPVVD
ncbi:hypothetical protein APHAL10511_000645 [Amanita phalloides]|nr:hypothetical protein APHAL10511_000645 [Amanita phalloides]